MRWQERSHWLAANARDWDGQKFQTWLDKDLTTKAGRQILEGAGKAIWGVEPRESSLLLSSSTSLLPATRTTLGHSSVCFLMPSRATLLVERRDWRFES